LLVKIEEQIASCSYPFIPSFSVPYRRQTRFVKIKKIKDFKRRDKRSMRTKDNPLFVSLKKPPREGIQGCALVFAQSLLLVCIRKKWNKTSLRIPCIPFWNKEMKARNTRKIINKSKTIC